MDPRATRALPLVRALFLAVALLAPALSFAATGASAPPPPDRRIALTIDDLPWASFGAGTPEMRDAHHPRLIAALRATKAPVVGFVNEGKFGGDDKADAAERAKGERMLRDWLDAGAELGNHTAGHVDLHAVGLPAYQDDILRGERWLRPALAARGAAPRWFRHPYLRAGRSAEDKAALAIFLDTRGYRIAPVTVDTSDWIWAGAYRKALAAGDEATLARLRAGYVPYMLAKIDYFEAQSIALLGYNLPQVLLAHANEINAATWVALVDGIRARGYRIVTLEDALRDPAYARADAYTGRWGPSWLHRWAIGEKKPREFFTGEPATPRWVLDLAGVEGE
jgi:peptidoglycan/xylan/chitin deacetylase (PgdA/CDA1 family)